MYPDCLEVDLNVPVSIILDEESMCPVAALISKNSKNVLFAVSNLGKLASRGLEIILTKLVYICVMGIFKDRIF